MKLRTGFKQVAAITALSFVGAQALAANTDSRPEERNGALIGGVVGAIAGGPIGAGVGALLGGALIGKSVGVHRINRELATENASLSTEVQLANRERSEAESRFKGEIAQLNVALNQARAEVDVVKTAPEVPIQFRTNSADIESHYQAHLAEIASTLSLRKDAKVTLSGFADRRGSSEYNQKLSEMRVEQVKTFLLNHGVSASQISTRAFGESKPVNPQQNRENDFFDRRVVMEFAIETSKTPIAAR